MYWSSILWYLSWPALIAASYFITSYVIKKYDPGKENKSEQPTV